MRLATWGTMNGTGGAYSASEEVTLHAASNHGFTILELLIVLAVAGILMAIGASTLMGLRGTLTVEEVAQQLVQDVQTTRARAMSSGNDWRLVVTDTQSYVLQEEDDSSGDWSDRIERTLPAGSRLANVSNDDLLEFDSRGFGNFVLTGGTPDQLSVTDGSDTITIVPSMSGAVKMERQ